MLPDLRIVLVAVVSTFICTVGVGFYASSRLLHESMRTDHRGGSDESPATRIALSWPEPIPADRNLSLDFAVTHRASKNPVRDVAPEPQPAPSTPEADKTAAVALTRSEKDKIAPSLVDDDLPTDSIGDSAPIVPVRPEAKRNANVPDAAAAQEGATKARGETPITRIRVVTKPVVAKVRAKKKAPVAAAPKPSVPPVIAVQQLEFPFTVFSRPSNLN